MYHYQMGSIAKVPHSNPNLTLSLTLTLDRYFKLPGGEVLRQCHHVYKSQLGKPKPNPRF